MIERFDGTGQGRKSSGPKGGVIRATRWVCTGSDREVQSIFKAPFSKAIPYEMTNEPPNSKPHCKHFWIGEGLANTLLKINHLEIKKKALKIWK